MMQPFAELGAFIERRWRDQDYSYDLFPEIASQALSEAQLIARVDPWEIIRWVHKTPSLPRQQDRKGEFGNPPITLFVGSRFYIDVYYWLDGTTSIHQHSFCGAFQVMAGSSVHSHYRFEQRREVNPNFLVGEILLQDISLLTQGDIKEIRSGPHFIHSLFHLERPSVTITVRTNHAAHDSIQYSYLKPHIAFDPFYHEDSLDRKVSTVSLLLSMKHPEADRFIIELLEDSDFQTTFCLLDAAFRFLRSNDLEDLFQVSKGADRFQAMLEPARRRHGALIDLVPPVFEEERRQKDITKRRGMIEGEDHRFFLALLLNVPERKMVLDLIKQKYPDCDPVELAARWIGELAKIRIFGSAEPNVLGIQDFDDNYLFVLKELLQGSTDDEISTAAAKDASLAGVPKESITGIASQIRQSPLFKVIFS